MICMKIIDEGWLRLEMKLNNAIFENIDYSNIPNDLIYSKGRLATFEDTELQLKIDKNTVDLYNTIVSGEDHVITRMKERSRELEIMTGGFIDDSYGQENTEEKYIAMLSKALQKIDVKYNMEPHHYMIFSKKEMRLYLLH